MKITKSKLKQIVKEEFESTMADQKSGRWPPVAKSYEDVLSGVPMPEHVLAEVNDILYGFGWKLIEHETYSGHNEYSYAYTVKMLRPGTIER